MTEAPDPLREIIGTELSRPASDDAKALAEAALNSVEDVRAILFYGSCLRDGLDAESVADLYIIVGRYRRSGQSWLAALANRALPPNVIYLEADASFGRVRAKAAIVSERGFLAHCRSSTFHSYFWARFAQPAALIYAIDEGAVAAAETACVEAVETFAMEAADRPIASTTPREFWTEGFRATYSAELRAEGPERATALYLADQARYDAIHQALTQRSITPRSGPGRWRLRRALGKALSVGRLAKAIFTFQGGLDYILWKIARHSGVVVEAKPWQRRWPLLAAPGLALKVWRLGGFR